MAIGNEVGQLTSYYTKYGKAVACVVVARDAENITVREGFDGDGKELTFPVTALRKLNPNAKVEVIDLWNTGR
ncbi:hypothetical protein [uncultured Halomonas sp.]|jgi:hypothetical protein|uniref:hypothetical protein n=1 Tax=uncultured Halomonas sp. TaxID=173971 RepID=UPI00260405C0|nr:hypothetical protein [uncultured Halomonas sp.]